MSFGHGKFVINSEDGEWKSRAFSGTTLFVFYADGYDQIVNQSGVNDTISFRFQREDLPVISFPSESHAVTRYFTPDLSGTFTTSEEVHYDLSNGTSVVFGLEGDYLTRRVSGRSSVAEVTFTLLVSGALVMPPMDCARARTTAVFFGSKHAHFKETSLGAEANQYLLPEIVMGEHGANALRYHLPVNAQSGSFNMTWLTYVGATDADELFAVDDLPDGGVVVCGRTQSANFPGMDSNDTLMGSYDMVIFRMDSAGQLLWTTIYGGLYFESANAIRVVDSSIYIAGATNGNDIPMFNAAQDSTGGSYDAVLLKMDFNGVILQSSYYGGVGAEQAYGIDVDSSGRLVFGGSSTSSAIPMSSLGYQPAGAGAVDAFIAVVSDTFAPVWSTFYGGTGTEDVHQLVVTQLNKIVLIGGTYSTNFPCTPNAFQLGKLGFSDAYYVVFDLAGNREYATYYGGSGGEDCYGVAGDAQGNIYIAGQTASIDFNTAGTTIQSSYSGLYDVWVAKFDTAGVPIFSTFYGGGMDDKTFGMELRGAYLYIAGSSQSSDLPMNVTAPQDSMWGTTDGFVLKMDTAGNYITSTFIGGSGLEEIYALTVNPDTMVTCVGSTYSNNLQVTVGAFQSVYVASGDGFVARYKLSEELFSSSVSTGSSSEWGEVSVFPNPTSNEELSVEANFEISQVVLIDAQGKMAKEIQNVNAERVTVNIAGLPAGIYLVRIAGANLETATEKIIVR